MGTLKPQAASWKSTQIVCLRITACLGVAADTSDLSRTDFRQLRKLIVEDSRVPGVRWEPRFRERIRASSKIRHSMRGIVAKSVEVSAMGLIRPSRKVVRIRRHAKNGRAAAPSGPTKLEGGHRCAGGISQGNVLLAVNWVWQHGLRSLTCRTRPETVVGGL